MSVHLRPITAEEVGECGRICFEAFAAIARHHNFPLDFPSAEAGAGFLGSMVENPGFYGVVAESDGRILGSNFMDERGQVFGLGPITVDPGVQNRSVGRELMEHMVERAAEKDAVDVRLLQAAYHNRSLCLYQKLGFNTWEPVSNLFGEPLGIEMPGHMVRTATPDDVPACDVICREVHGFDRSRQLQEAIARGDASVDERDGQIVGYTTGISFAEHTVALTNDGLKALIGAAPEIPRPGFLLPARNGDVFRWCLENGLRQSQLMTYMALREYREPRGSFLCSILY